MGHGEFKGKQAEAIRPFVDGKVIHDLGCGTLELAHQLLDLGASEVVAIDRHSPSRQLLKTASPRIKFIGKYFHDFHDPVETVFVSWPINWYDYGLGQILDRAKTVIYLGTNLDGSACGYSDMWMVLSHRKILAHVPDRKNTLLVYSSDFEVREPVPEEKAAQDPSVVYRFDDVYGSGVPSGDGQAHQRTG